MTPEKEAELFAKLDLMLELYRRLETDMRTEIAGLRNEMRHELQGLRDEVHQLGNRVSRLEGRAEEQSQILQIALGSRVTRKTVG